MTITEGVSTEIRVLLARRDMSQRDLAERSGISQVAISRRMTGAIPWDLTELEAVANALDVPASVLIPRETEPVASAS